MPALQHGDTGAEARGFKRHRQTGKSRPDHADIDIQVEGKTGTQGCIPVGAVGRTCESFSHVVFLRTAAAIVTLSQP